MAICGLWNSVLENKLYKGKSLLHIVLKTIIFYDISLVRFVCDAEYAKACKTKVKMTLNGDGIVDRVIYLTADFTKENKILLNMILSPDG